MATKKREVLVDLYKRLPTNYERWTLPRDYQLSLRWICY